MPKRPYSLHVFQHTAKQFKAQWKRLNDDCELEALPLLPGVTVLAAADSERPHGAEETTLEPRSQALITADILLVAWKNLFLI